MLILSACFTITVAALLLPGPIWLLRREEKSSPRIWIIFVIVFFSALGTGFMFIEMSFIQMFTRFMGDPVLAAALVWVGFCPLPGSEASDLHFSQKSWDGDR